MKLQLLALVVLSSLASAFAALPFSLTDSDPESPEFRKNYLGSYGINAAIEPTLSEDDRPLYLSVLPFLQSDPSQAILLLEEKIQADSNAAFNFLLGSLYYMQDRLDLAKEQLLACIVKHPSFRRAHRTLSLVYARQDNVDGAIPHLLKVIELGGGDGQSYGMLGYAYLREEKYHSSLASYQNARIFAPDSLDYKRGVAQCLLATQQYEQAVALYDELIAENPKEPEFWLLQANALLVLDKRAETAANLEMARSLGASDFNNFALLASLYFEDGVYGLGVQVATQALELAGPDDFPSVIRQLEYLVQRDLMEFADTYANVFERTLLADISDKETDRFEAAAAAIDFARDRDSSGLARLKAILDRNPLDGRCLVLLGRHHMGNGEYEEAEYYYERALSVDAFKVEALVALGQSAVGHGEFAESLDYLYKAQELRFDTNVHDYIVQIKQALKSVR